MSLWTQMSATTQCTHACFCKDNKPQEIFFFLKNRRLKRAYSARETLYQKWNGAGHHMRKKNKQRAYCTCTPKMKAGRSFIRLFLHDNMILELQQWARNSGALVIRSQALAFVLFCFFCAMQRFFQGELTADKKKVFFLSNWSYQ